MSQSTQPSDQVSAIMVAIVTLIEALPIAGKIVIASELNRHLEAHVKQARERAASEARPS